MELTGSNVCTDVWLIAQRHEEALALFLAFEMFRRACPDGFIAFENFYVEAQQAEQARASLSMPSDMPTPITSEGALEVMTELLRVIRSGDLVGHDDHDKMLDLQLRINATWVPSSGHGEHSL